MSDKIEAMQWQAINDVEAELKRACELHRPLNSAHEAYSVILEEVDEFWEQVRLRRESRSRENMRKELVQIGAMACRALVDLRLVDDGGDGQG